MTQPEPTNVVVPTPDGSMPAQMWLPPAGAGPGLVMVQEIFGVSTYIRRRSAELAALGYVVLAPELYWRLPDASVDEGSDDVVSAGMALASQLPWDTAVADVVQAVRELRTRPEVDGGVGLFGFCYGGGLAFNAAALEPADVLVSYYGSALPGLLHLSEQVTIPSLHHFGLADAFVPPEEVQRIQTTLSAMSNVSFETYPGANHAFDNSHLPELHHPEASDAAWRTTTQFLAEQLPVPPSRG